MTVENNSRKFLDYQKVLGLEAESFESLKDLRKQIDLRIQMWDSYKDIKCFAEQWRLTPLNFLDIEVVKQKTDALMAVVKSCQKALIPNQVLDQLKTRVYEYRDTMPVVEALKNTNLVDHHWTEINRIIGKILIINDDFLL